MTSALDCPSCQQAMLAHRFPRKLGGDVELDLCFACQGIWFDEYESLQLTPAGVIDLFHLIHDHEGRMAQAQASRLRCPRCRETLIPSQDRVKSGLFNYLRCGQQHGRYITFAQFMIEKGFVRQLNKMEIDQLAVRIGTVRCTGCGAPVDIRLDSTCTHCRAPIAMLDADAVGKALRGYHLADEKQRPNDPDVLADAVLARAREENRWARERQSLASQDIGDLILSGIGALLGRLRKD